MFFWTGVKFIPQTDRRPAPRAFKPMEQTQNPFEIDGMELVVDVAPNDPPPPPSGGAPTAPTPGTPRDGNEASKISSQPRIFDEMDTMVPLLPLLKSGTLPEAFARDLAKRLGLEWFSSTMLPIFAGCLHLSPNLFDFPAFPLLSKCVPQCPFSPWCQADGADLLLHALEHGGCRRAG